MNNNQRYQEALSRGHTFSWDQRWEEAIHEFESAIQESPDMPAPYAGLGMAFFELSQLDRALENYKQAARFSSGDLVYLRHVADVQERLGLVDEAGQTYMAIGEICLKRKEIDEALNNWQQAVRLSPGLLGAHQRLASSYRQRGLIRNAIREYLAVARILQSQGEQEKALSTCQLALQLAPRNAEILTAIELINRGETTFPDTIVMPLPRNEVDTASRSNGTMETMSGELGRNEDDHEHASPVEEAHQVALEQLAEKLFDEEEESTVDVPVGEGLTKVELDALISQALDYQTRNKVSEAISSYERAIQGGMTSPAAHFNLALLYQDKLRFDDAIREFTIAVQEPEFRLGSHFALGECYRARGRIDKAVEHFITVLKIVDLATVEHQEADRLIVLYENLSDSLISKGEPEQATAFANTLVDFLSHRGWEDKVKEARSRLDALSGDHTMILAEVLTAGSQEVLESLYLSQEYARRGLFRSAAEETYRAIQLSPNYLPAHITLAELLWKQNLAQAAATKYTAIGDIYRAKGDVGGAIKAYEHVVEIAPVDVSMRARLIDLLKSHGQIDSSLEHYLAMGQAYYQLAQVDRARTTYESAIKLTPRSSNEKEWRIRFLRLIADIDLERLEWRRALGTYQVLWEEEPDDERTGMTLIDLNYKTGHPDQALRILDEYLIRLIKSGRSGKVLGILEDMVAQRPQDPGSVRRLARLYTQQKRPDAAIEILEKLGEHQIEAGDIDQAQRTINQIILLDPPNADEYESLLQELQPTA